MKAIHGGKAKTDKIDAHMITVLHRGGVLPQAYVYPKGMRETRDLLCRPTFLVRRRAEDWKLFCLVPCLLQHGPLREHLAVLFAPLRGVKL
jgi:hypothetical protein